VKRTVPIAVRDGDEMILATCAQGRFRTASSGSVSPWKARWRAWPSRPAAPSISPTTSTRPGFERRRLGRLGLTARTGLVVAAGVRRPPPRHPEIKTVVGAAVAALDDLGVEAAIDRGAVGGDARADPGGSPADPAVRESTYADFGESADARRSRARHPHSVEQEVPSRCPSR
jgi:hypothetical protein